MVEYLCGKQELLVLLHSHVDDSVPKLVDDTGLHCVPIRGQVSEMRSDILPNSDFLHLNEPSTNIEPELVDCLSHLCEE